MIRDLFIRLFNDLNTLDPNRLTLVTYEDKNLVYRQVGKIISLPYLNLFYFPPKGKFRYGVLTQSGLMKLLDELLRIIQDRKLDNDQVIFSPTKFGTLGYTLVENKRLNGPQVLYQLDYVNVTNRLYAWFLLRNATAETKLLLKHISTNK